MTVTIRETTADVGETYRYRGEVRRRPKYLRRYFVRCSMCGWGEPFGLISAARRARDAHVCHVEGPRP